MEELCYNNDIYDVLKLLGMNLMFLILYIEDDDIMLSDDYIHLLLLLFEYLLLLLTI